MEEVLNRITLKFDALGALTKQNLAFKPSLSTVNLRMFLYCQLQYFHMIYIKVASDYHHHIDFPPLFVMFMI